MAVAYQHVRENPVRRRRATPRCRAALDSIVMKALAKNQLNRYQSAGEMRADLQRALADQPVAAEAVMTDAERTQFIARTPCRRSAAAPRRVLPGAGRRRAPHRGLIWAAVVVALLLVIGVAVAAVVLHRQERRHRRRSRCRPVVGQTETAAQNALRAAELVPANGGDTNGPCDDNADGRRRAASAPSIPAARPKVARTATVTYHLFTPKTVAGAVRDGKAYADAAAELHGVGPRRRGAGREQPGRGQGTVIAQRCRGVHQRGAGHDDHAAGVHRQGRACRTSAA